MKSCSDENMRKCTEPASKEYQRTPCEPGEPGARSVRFRGVEALMLGTVGSFDLSEHMSGVVCMPLLARCRVVLDLLRKLTQTMHLAAVIVTHDLAVARLLAHRMIVMQQGRIVEHGLTDQVLDDPQHAYTQLLVSSVLPP